MDTATDPKAIWSDYLASLAETERRHVETCGRCMGGYARYYDLASRTSDRAAAAALPEDVAAAGEVEASAAVLAEMREAAMPSLARAMSAKMSVAARAGEGDAADLRDALAAVDRFRVEELDGRHGRMAELVMLGAGALGAEKDRLLNAMVSVWCKTVGIKPREAVAMLRPYAFLLPGFDADGPERFVETVTSLGMDAAAALDAVAGWEELNQSKVDEARRLVGKTPSIGI